jgi:hypothetical protein
VGWVIRNWVLFLAGARDFPLLCSVRIGYGVHWLLDSLFLEENWWMNEGDHSSSFSVADKNMWAYL